MSERPVIKIEKSRLRSDLPLHIRTDPLALIRKGELAALLGVNPWTLDNWRKRGRIPQPIVLSPNIVAWRRPDIERWLVERELQPGPTRHPREEAKERKARKRQKGDRSS